MYRAVTYLAITNNVSFSDEEGLVSLIKSILSLFTTRRWAACIHSIKRRHTRNPSARCHKSCFRSLCSWESKRRTSCYPTENRRTRWRCDGRKRHWDSCIAECRSKNLLVASVSERAERRFKENQEKGIPTDLETLTKEIQARDHYDSTREVSPLQQAEDAVRIDTT